MLKLLKLEYVDDSGEIILRNDNYVLSHPASELIGDILMFQGYYLKVLDVTLESDKLTLTVGKKIEIKMSR